MRREENSKNKFEHYKFVLSKITSWYSHEKTYSSRYESNYYVEFIRWLKNLDPENADKRQKVKDLFGLKNLTSTELEIELSQLRSKTTRSREKINSDNVDVQKLVKYLKTRNPMVKRQFIELQKICEIHDLETKWIDDDLIIYDFKFSPDSYTFQDELKDLNLLSFCIDVLKSDDEKLISNFEQNELNQVIRDLWNGSKV